MTAFERWVPRLALLRALRRRALARCLDRIRFEQEASNFQGLSPVNGILNTIALFAHDPHDPMLAPSLAGVESWRWDDDRGRHPLRRGALDVLGHRLRDAGRAAPGPSAASRWCRRAYAFLDGAQETGELAERRERSARCNSGRLVLQRWPPPLAGQRLHRRSAERASCRAFRRFAGGRRSESQPNGWTPPSRFILDRQNDDGGFGTYERRRGPAFLERLNPSEMFGDCMTELSYVECTASAVMALCRFREHYPDRQCDAREPGDRRLAATSCVRDSVPTVRGPASGASTSPTRHGLRSLRCGPQAPRRRIPRWCRAAEWLTSKQKPDGGWGEHYSGCLNATYVDHPQSQPVMTSWALLALLDTAGPRAQSGAARHRLAVPRPACRRFLARRHCQRRFLRLRHAVVPALSGLFPALGPQPLLRRGLRCSSSLIWTSSSAAVGWQA